jgi:hypothetical protein
MEQVVPVVRRYGGFAIMVVNEPDNFLGPDPSLTPRVVNFVKAARDQIHAIDPDMAVGVALSNGFDWDDDGGRIRGPRSFHTALIDVSDVAVYNMYCTRTPISRLGDSVRQRVQSRINAAKGKDVIFQEVGCPSGGEDGLSIEHQRTFFEEYFKAVSGTSVRVSVVFQLVDWTQGTIKFYADAIQPLFDAEPAFRDNPNLIFVYLQQLSSVGMIDATNGEPKPSWNEFIKALQRGG